jgi:hypothetical protein
MHSLVYRKSTGSCKQISLATITKIPLIIVQELWYHDQLNIRHTAHTCHSPWHIFLYNTCLTECGSQITPVTCTHSHFSGDRFWYTEIGGLVIYMYIRTHWTSPFALYTHKWQNKYENIIWISNKHCIISKLIPVGCQIPFVRK